MRLARAEQPGGAWSSDLSVQELAALVAVGLEPAGLVLGSSVYNLSGQLGPLMWGQGAGGWWRSYPCPHGWYHEGARTGYNVEHVPYERGLTEARDLALARMQAEAAELGAHGVAGMRVNLSRMEGTWSAIELTAVGTALRRAGRPPSERPFTSHLTGQQLGKLLRGGWVPTAMVMGVGVVEMAPGCGIELRMSSWANAELPQLSEAVQATREIAVQHLQSEAAGSGGDGVVGVSVDFHVRELGGEAKLCELLAMGTAVRRFSDVPLPEPPLVVMPLADRPGRPS
ncbi:MAG: heavy metal-binding domain-containing protein [Acidimicrobiales bacterium]